ncbi:MAG: DUF4834 family protein [Tannerella sp.]|jgi:ATP-dependent Zn protease|nr:DUF4834 family protein [Tannerella sp.]
MGIIRTVLILVFVIYVVPFLLRIAMRFFFGSRQFGSPSQSQSQNRSQQGSRASSAKSDAGQSSRKKKVISEEEGEYVDYVEVRE